MKLPLIPGIEVVGLTPDGRRVVGLLPGGGGYAERALLPPIATVDVPEGVDDAQALAIIIEGATAWHLLRTSTHMQPGETVVVHAGAGGVGSLAIQLAKRWGAGKVLAAASSEERALAAELGADVTLDSAAAEDPEAIREAAGGPVDVVLEMVGGPTFDASLAALQPFGRLAIYGMAGRVPPKPLNPAELVGTNAWSHWLLLAALPRARGHVPRPQVEELLGMVAADVLRTILGGTYPLGDAWRAHEDLRARRTAGKLVLDPRA